MTAYHLDLCSGIGGFALAARWLGMQTIGFCEIDPFCQRVLAKNFPGVPIHDDLTTLDAGTVRDWTNANALANSSGTGGRAGSQPNGTREETAHRGLGLITGGYPCQPFSLAGKRLGAEDDRHLWPYIAALVADLRPRYCLFENVAGHITLGLDRVLADLEALGYTCRPVVVPACALNAPHRRDRVWLMAHAERSGRREHVRTDTAQEPLPQAIGREGAPWFGPGSSTLAVSDSGRRDGRSHIEGQGSSERGRAGSNGQDNDPHANGTGPQGRSERFLRSRKRVARKMGAESFLYSRQAQSGLGVQDDGLSGRLDGRLARPWDTDWEAGVPRVSDGCVDRVNKLKALGNAIVPQVAYVLMAGMMEA